MKKLVKLLRDPALFFQDAARNRRAATRTGTPTYVVGFSTWKQYMRKFFPDRNLTFLPREISEHEFNLVWSKKILSDRNAEIFIWGFKAPPYILQFIKKNNVKVMFVEDGFVRSVQLGASKAPPMSLCLDSRTPYFNARETSDLELMLLKHDFASDSALLDRADKAIALLLKSGVSKYNHAVPVDVTRLYGAKKGKRVLVIGQVEDDASIEFGCEQNISNNDLVRLAARENPGAQIIYKPHPDVLAGHRDMQSDPEDVAGLALILRDKLPLAQALDTIDHVYTVTSLAGFEALLRGIKVTAMGAPFYAGWGLTDDRQPIPRRQRKLALRELFAGAYLLYPRYFDPASGEQRQLEDVIALIASAAQLAATAAPVMPTVSNAPAKVKPVVIEEEQEEQEEEEAIGQLPTYLVGEDLSYRDLMDSWFNERSFTHIPSQTTEAEFVARFKKIIDRQPHAEFFVCGDNVASYLRRYIAASRKPVSYLSEGYLRSVELAGSAAPPYSLLLDRSAPHYDARRTSGLEEILNGYDFDADTTLMERSALLQTSLLRSGLSKYNHVAPVPDLELLYGTKDRPRVLVLGEVEGTASFKLANPRNYTVNDLVIIAVMENPGAQIIFKPHPKVLSKHAVTASDPAKIEDRCLVLKQDLPLAQALETIDKVYTISSLGGFEALLRGIHTSTFGLPFYAGWGLGDDRQPLPRRQRKLSVTQVFAASYLLYPVYLDPLYKMSISFERAVERLQELVDIHRSEGADILHADEALPADSAVISTYIFGDFNFRSLLSSWFDNRKFHQIPGNVVEKEFDQKYKKRLDADNLAEFFVAGECPSFISRYIERSQKKVTYLESGFIRSAQLDDGKTPPFSLLLDNKAPHYDSRCATDLEDLLNRYDFSANLELKEYSGRLLEQFIRSGLSKYNHVPLLNSMESVYGVKERRRVLVLGQVESSASFRLANPRNYANNDLVKIAAMENPGAQIIFKPHPDVLNKLQSTASDPAKVKHLCQVLERDVPLAQSLETIDHVYTVSSLGGFEAILRGIPTTTLGLPFYSGWGVADDRLQIKRRHRKLTVEQIFSAAYVLYPHYVDPLYRTRIEAFDSINRIATEYANLDDESVALTVNDELVLAKNPDGRKTAFLLVFHPWKREFFEKVFSAYKVYFLPSNISAAKLEQLLDFVVDSELIIWGYKENDDVARFIRERKIKVRRVEDGFVRSIALGAEHSLPASIAIDGSHLYFDATGQSELERILAEYDFKSDSSLLAEAGECISLMLANGISKYNHVGAKSASDILGEKKGKRILVVGQVEDDASIRFGSNRKILNNDLVILARLENPDADIFYKPHPDVLNGYREHRSDPRLVECYAKVIYEPLALADALVDVDHVYTITSLAGFEALIRGIKVTTFGCPFYSGWGLTDDRQPNSRRVRKLDILELFAGAYLLYPKYFDLVTQEPCGAKKIIMDLTVLRKKMNDWEHAKRLEVKEDVPFENKSREDLVDLADLVELDAEVIDPVDDEQINAV